MTSTMTTDDIARAAALDVARLLDRRGLRDVVALARRVLRDTQQRGPVSRAIPRRGEHLRRICTLRQHEWPARRRAADRTADDDRP
jgi:hypothetical protein